MADTTDIAAVADARSLEAVVDGVLALFGPGARLYLVDRAFTELVPADARVDGPVPLRGDLRTAILRTEPFADGAGSWIPLPERSQSVFVVRLDHELSMPDVSPTHLGAVLRGHRNRFEDLERKRRRASMSVAAEMQWDFLPQRADSFGDYDVASVLEPAYEVAGDVFEYAMSEGALWVYSFDGMGHGMEATLSSVLALSAVRNVRRGGGSLVAQMEAANRELFELFGGDRFVTGAACRIEMSGAVSVVNAGHETIRNVAGGVVARLDLHAQLPLGVSERPLYSEQAAASLAPGDGLVLFSDGATDSTSPDGSTFGGDRLDDTLRELWSTVPLRTGHDVVEAVMDFIGGGDVADDITAVIVRRREMSAA